MIRTQEVEKSKSMLPLNKSFIWTGNNNNREKKNWFKNPESVHHQFLCCANHFRARFDVYRLALNWKLFSRVWQSHAYIPLIIINSNNLMQGENSTHKQSYTHSLTHTHHVSTICSKGSILLTCANRSTVIEHTYRIKMCIKISAYTTISIAQSIAAKKLIIIQRISAPLV